MSKKVWLVTGCSKGLGKALVEELIAQGYSVAGTSRSKESLEKNIREESDLFLPLSMNVKDEADVKKAIAQATEKFGRIDVVVNNAGFTHLATIEEMSDADVREEFDINVFGTLNVIRSVLPQMRAQKSGHIFNVSSLGAYNVGPLSGIYCATKHAIKAISETLAQEVREFGIRVTDVKPGFMRTEFFGSSYKTTAPEGSPYKHLYDENMEFYMGQNGNQAGDPKKAAKLYIQVAEMDEPYESLPMGTDSCNGIRDICENTVKLMTEMRSVAKTTNF
ncbi:MAG: SDR family oxidoreductase [Lachnospiraceae bacterium]|nr:SDR family oxidoreductase [Lachnospiraceae bacterium]